MKTFVDAQIKHAPSNVKPRRAGRAINPLVTCAEIAFVGFLASIACAVPSFAQIVGTVQLNIERRGHTATLLEDGKVLIVGGDNQSGIVNQVELLDPAAQTSSLASMPIVARTDHTATRLADGRVLIIGGRDQNGSLTSTEIYNPLTATFTAGRSLTTPRNGHTATVLANGAILVAGGDASGSAELYNPTTQSFSLIAGSMNTARKFHSAILLNNGQVLIAGGVGAQNNVLNTAEVYDPSSQSFYLPPTDMQTPRALATLRLLPDGKVQVIGGDSDFSMEIFDPQVGNFNGVAYLPPTPALLGATLSMRSRAALISPTASQNPNLLGTSLTPEQLDLLDRADQTITELPSQNKALVAGGINSGGQVLNSASLVSSSPASVTTDKTDYAPGTIVTITGRGFKANEGVALTLHERPEEYADPAFVATADEQGNFIFMQFAPQSIDIGRTFTLTAIGQISGFSAQTAFTDSNPNSVALDPTSRTITAGNSALYDTTVTMGGNTNQCTVTLSVTTVLPTGATASFDNNPVTTNATFSRTLTIATTTATAAGTYPFTVQAQRGSNCQGNGNLTANGTLIVESAKSATTTTAANKTATFSATDQTVALTATVTSSGTVNQGTVTFTVKKNTTVIGSPVTSAQITTGSASANFTLPGGTAADTYTIEAAYSGGTNFNSSGDNNKTLTVQKASPTFSNLTASQTIPYGTASINLSGKIAAGTSIPRGQTVKATINSVDSSPATIASDGTFSITFDTHAIPASATPYTIAYIYAGDTNFNSASDTSTTLTVNKATPTVTLMVSNSPQTYNGSPKAAVVTISVSSVNGTVNNVKYNGSATVPTNAGTYAITADFEPDDTTNYNSLTGLSAGNFVINKIDPVITATGNTCNYSGSPCEGTGSVTPASLGYVLKYYQGATLLAGAPVNAGSYTVVAHTDGDGNYNAKDSAPATITINKIDPVITATGNTCNYSGSPCEGTGSVTPASLGYVLKYYQGATLLAGAPVNAGSYTVVAHTDGDGNYNAKDSAPATITINKIDPVITATGNTCNYSGSPCEGTGSVTPASLGYVLKYYQGATLLAGAPVNAGSYTVVAHTDGDGNYNAKDSAPATITINKIDPVITATGNTCNYSGSPCEGTGSVTPASLGYVLKYYQGATLLAGAPVNAGSYTVVAHTDGDGNYNAKDSAPATITINKIDPVITATGNTCNYSGSPCEGTGSVTPASLGYVLKYYQGATLLAGAPVNAGSYTVVAHTDGDGNYNAKDSAPATITINKIDPVITATGNTCNYSGSPCEGTGSVTPASLGYVLKYYQGATLLAGAPVNAGSYTVVAHTDGDGNYNAKDSAPATITINKIDPVITATGNTCNYSGSPCEGTGSVTPASLGYVLKYYQGATLLAGAPVNAGSYTVVAHTDGDGNYNAKDSAPATITINKIDPVITATGNTCNYSGSPCEGTGSVTPASLGYVLKYYQGATLLAGAPVNAGSYTVVAHTDGDGNYNAKDSAPATITINKIDPVITATGNTCNYSGSPCEGTGSVTPASLGYVLKYYQGATLLAGAPVNAGSYTVVAHTDGDGNYNAKDSAPATITINPALVTATAGSGSATYDGATKSPSACVVSGTYKGDLTCVNNPASVGPGAGTTTIYPVVSGTGLTNFQITKVNGSYTIDKATPTATLVVSNSPQTYSGSPKAAVVTISASSVNGTINNVKYNGSATVPINTGTYAITADFEPDDTSNYNSLTGLSAGNFTIAAWNLTGFYQPVDMPTQPTPTVPNPPIVYNTIKGGSTVPFKFNVYAGSIEQASTSAVKSIQSQQFVCSAGYDAEIPSTELSATGGTALRYDTTGRQFIYNWQTAKHAGDCYRVTMTTQDGSTLFAYFKTK